MKQHSYIGEIVSINKDNYVIFDKLTKKSDLPRKYKRKLYKNLPDVFYRCKGEERYPYEDVYIDSSLLKEGVKGLFCDFKYWGNGKLLINNSYYLYCDNEEFLQVNQTFCNKFHLFHGYYWDLCYESGGLGNCYYIIGGRSFTSFYECYDYEKGTEFTKVFHI